MHNHNFGVLSETFEESKNLTDFYNILATDNLENGKEFPVAIEAKNYPFSAIIFHPEKH